MNPGFLFVVALVATPDSVQTGHHLFHDPGFGETGVACATCHAPVVDEAERGDGLLRAGHPLGDVARRMHWWGDEGRKRYRSLSDALEVCPEVFMRRDPLASWEGRALVAYLESLAPRSSRKRPAVRIVPALEADFDYDRRTYRGGEADRGRVVFYLACHGCHPHGRAGLGPSLIGRSFFDVARKVREGNGVLRGQRKPGAWSPPFGTDRLSDRQVADVGAYVETLAQTDDEPALSE